MNIQINLPELNRLVVSIQHVANAYNVGSISVPEHNSEVGESAQWLYGPFRAGLSTGQFCGEEPIKSFLRENCGLVQHNQPGIFGIDYIGCKSLVDVVVHFSNHNIQEIQANLVVSDGAINGVLIDSSSRIVSARMSLHNNLVELISRIGPIINRVSFPSSA